MRACACRLPPAPRVPLQSKIGFRAADSCNDWAHFAVFPFTTCLNNHIVAAAPQDLRIRTGAARTGCMSETKPHMGRTGHLSLSMDGLTEAFWERYRRLHDAIDAEDIPLVHRLDRELTNALMALVDHQTHDAAEQQAQFTALLRLLREEAEDASSVRNNADLIELLLRRYITVRTRPADQNGLPALSAPVRNGVLDIGQLDTLAERVAVVTTDYRYLYANATDAARLKRKPHELVGRHVRDIVGAEHFNNTIKDNLDRCFAGETVEYTTARERDGEVVVVRRRLTPCYSEGPTMIGALVVIHEGPDRRRRDH